MSWTNVNKPSTLSWIPVHSSGNHIYDDTEITFDDANTYYEDGNPFMWSNVAKPTTPSSWVSIPKPV